MAEETTTAPSSAKSADPSPDQPSAQLILNTSRFGEVVLGTDRIINFVRPVLGFEGKGQYVLLDHMEESPFKWLQSIEDPNLAFVVTNPAWFGVDYSFEVPDSVLELLDIQAAEDVMVLTIVTIPNDNPTKVTANLLGPLVINQNNRQAMQLVLSDSQYATKTPLIPDGMLPDEDGPSGKESSKKA